MSTPAFPFPVDYPDFPAHRGMDLRDYFAGQVLTSAAVLPLGRSDYEHRAKVAYGQADAMIAAREVLSMDGDLNAELLAVLKEAADFVQPFNRAEALFEKIEAAIEKVATP